MAVLVSFDVGDGWGYVGQLLYSDSDFGKTVPFCLHGGIWEDVWIFSESKDGFDQALVVVDQVGGLETVPQDVV